MRNMLKIDTDKEFYNDADVLLWKKAVTLSGGVYEEAEAVSG